QGSLGRWNHVGAARIDFNRHAQRAAEGLEDRLDLVVRVDPAQVVDVQGHQRVVHEALEKFIEQVHIEATHRSASERDVVFQTGTSGEVDDNPRQRLVQGDIGVAVAADTLAVQRLVHRHAQCDANIFNGVVCVNVQVTVGLDIQIH